VHALITADKFVGEGETRHTKTALHPEDGGKRARKKDALHSREHNKTLSEDRPFVGYPFECPIRLVLNTSAT